MSSANVIKSDIEITPAQCRAARGLLDWSQERLAEATGGKITKRLLIRFENGEGRPRPDNLSAIRTALEAAGVEFIGAEGDGLGVRFGTAESNPPDTLSD